MDTTTRPYDEFPGPATRVDETRIAVAAVFTDRESAHDAAHHLHEEGFRDTWIGLIRNDAARDGAHQHIDDVAPQSAGDVRIESDNWFTRFFAEGDESLSEALARHGVDEADILTAGPLAAFGAILTVDGNNHPELAAQIITADGGRIITRGFGAMGYGTPGQYGFDSSQAPQAPQARTTSLDDDGVTGITPVSGAAFAPANDGLATTDIGAAGDERAATAYEAYGHYRAGTPIDDSARLQLRQERLRVDTAMVPRGEATVGTEVITETQNFDVPIIREELFIERRPVSGASAATSNVPIGETETVRVPLMQEQVVVTKEAVVTEEVIIGKRQVSDTAHVSETTRTEQLKVSDLTDDARDSGRAGAIR